MNLSKSIIKWFSIAMLCLASIESFAALQSHQKQFISNVLTGVRQANQEVLSERAQLQALYAKWHTNGSLAALELKQVKELATQYKVASSEFKTEASWQKLMQRVDVLPESLVLAQAINESAWGKSHVAKKRNNYFGRFSFKPHRRAEYKQFASLSASVKDYLHNINTHSAYDGLRKQRHVAHTGQKKLNGTMLATGLRRYSERGPVYIARLQKIIKSYKLDQFDTV